MPLSAVAADRLIDLGWSAFFSDQVAADEADLVPVRITSVHRARLSGMTAAGPVELTLPPHTVTGDYAVGDWVLADPEMWLLRRLLDRKTVLARRVGDGSIQLSGSNIDTLFIVTSCNADFNIARLERYLAFANQAGTQPVVVLTKADTAEDANTFRDAALKLQRDLTVLITDPRQHDAAEVLRPWCGSGQTVSLVGSSGVGKSTLVNTLSGPGLAPQLTGGIREQDAKGRHTTTARSLHPIANGGWVMDTPGIRTLHISEMAEGLDEVFSEISGLTCKFRDCTHEHEPGCAVRAAIADGSLDPERLARWRKLQEENAAASQSRENGSGRPGRRGR
ncbi:GTPase RsgA [Devosia epidermidihirudinis]|uniref:Small ribosomal subunit biogenesis GTPase RsgA n=1 Tax=Devosia epidermidihirudinis TaxID=1293439 RepID=A0A0F5QKK7_9HYPH|nr:ribosome small subunit-dependent GTPase A [Devosia epidermidihirudinis]KKC41505.1 GTPase RsgA [Devosia epidermidihirudinis]